MNPAPPGSSGRDRFRQAVRDVGIGFGSAAVVLFLLLRGTVAAVELAVVATTLFATVWVLRAPSHRLVGPSGRTVFLGFGIGLLLAAGANAVRPSTATVGSFLILVVGMVGAILRRLTHE